MKGNLILSSWQTLAFCIQLIFVLFAFMLQLDFCVSPFIWFNHFCLLYSCASYFHSRNVFEADRNLVHKTTLPRSVKNNWKTHIQMRSFVVTALVLFLRNRSKIEYNYTQISRFLFSRASPLIYIACIEISFRRLIEYLWKGQWRIIT